MHPHGLRARFHWIVKKLRRPAFTWFEHFLLIAFIALRSWALYETYKHPAGFDAGAHMEMLKLISWEHPGIPLHDHFYAYHPPLGFLLARSLMVLGLTPEASVQWISFSASLIAFLFVRQTLKYIQALRSPAGLIFLYGAFCIPIQIFLSISINLDILVFAVASIVLYLSIRLFWRPFPHLFTHPKAHPKISRILPWALSPLIIFFLALGMMFKFSGLLIFAIPPTVAMLRPLKAKWLKHCIWAALLSAVALALVFPYYFTRYYRTEGTFFPNNGNWIIADAQREAREKRSANPVQFFVDFFDETHVHTDPGIRHRDYEVLRFSDTWRDFWIKDQFLSGTPDESLWLGKKYFWMFPMLMLIGFPLFLLQLRLWKPWQRFGVIVVGYSLLQLLSFISYLYSEPFAGWGPAKGIYVAPMALGIAYIISELGGEHIPPRWRQWALFILLLAFIAANHVVPAYT